MVHRIQNRNPGYSDFTNLGNSNSFNFSSSSANTITQGANALKLENEVSSEVESNVVSSNIANEEGINIQQNTNESDSVVATTEIDKNIEKAPLENFHVTDDKPENESNGLENFGIEEETPELFNQESETTSSETSLTDSYDDHSEDEDDLEIPAFLRRQKN